MLHFTGDHKVLVGDKTGEVKGYPLGDWTAAAGEHLLGHFSMLLDMVRFVENIAESANPMRLVIGDISGQRSCDNV